MESKFIKASFASLFPAAHKDIQRLIAHWSYHFLKVSRLGMYLGRERLLALTVFGHKLVLNTSDFHSLKALFRPTPSDLTLCALFNVMHTPHACYLFINPCHAFHIFQPATLGGYGNIRVVDSRDRLFDIAQNLQLNEMDVELLSIESSYWERIPNAEIAPPLQSLEPFLEYTPSSSRSGIVEGYSFEAFEKTVRLSQSSSLEELLSDDFMNLRAIVLDKASFGQLKEEDLQNLSLLNPGCALIAYLCAEDSYPEATKEKLAKAGELGYHIWQLPSFKVLNPATFERPVFGRWVFLAKSEFI